METERCKGCDKKQQLIIAVREDFAKRIIEQLNPSDEMENEIIKMIERMK